MTNRAVTKSEFAYNEIKSLILAGKLEPGTRLNLRPLADQLGVSVMPVRDALRVLVSEGLVTFTSHRGAHVASVSRETIIDCLGTRMWIEALAVTEGVSLHTERTLRRAEEALEAGDRALRSGNGASFSSANRKFHEAIEAPADGLAVELINDLWDRLWQVRRQSSLFVLLPEHMDVAQGEHRDIYAAVAARNAKQATAAMQRHRTSSIAAWRRAFQVQDERELQQGDTPPRAASPTAR